MKTIFAHRGMSSLAPENTSSAFALCSKYGLSWVECDVDLLGDGTLVLTHDDTLDRCTDAQGRFCDLNIDSLQQIDAGSWFSDDYIGERILTFKQFIELANRYRFNINVEIKPCAHGWAHTLQLIDGVIEGLKRLRPDLKVLVSCFNLLTLYEFKRKSPNTDVACLFEQGKLPTDWQTMMQACQASAIHLCDQDLTKETVIELKEKGFCVNVYTVNDLSRANQLFNWGVDGIFTDIGHLFPARYRSSSNLTLV